MELGVANMYVLSLHLQLRLCDLTVLFQNHRTLGDGGMFTDLHIPYTAPLYGKLYWSLS